MKHRLGSIREGLFREDRTHTEYSQYHPGGFGLRLNRKGRARGNQLILFLPFCLLVATIRVVLHYTLAVTD